MSRRPTKVTQADIARALRAAAQTGAGYVEVRPDGTIMVKVSPGAPLTEADPLEPAGEIVL